MPDDAECANPQLLAWVKEWYDVARERNSKGATVYRNAYESLKACPLVFQHPAELQQLKGFGLKLCERLTAQLQKHCQQHGQPMPEHPQVRKAAERAQQAEDEDAAGEGAGKKKKKTARKPKPYVPAFRSGAYALVLGLSTQPEDSNTGMTKAELIEVSQPHCDASFTAPPDPTKFYTAWNSMKTLVQKELVYERGVPLKRYALTDDGWDVAKRIKDTREWHPGSFTVHLVLDVREVRAKTDRDYMQDELAKQGVKPIMRSLAARRGGDEIVLDWIVERKRLDDLIGSIKDGRFHEQKFRLRRSGVKKVIYIIEDISIDPATLQRYEESVQSAIASTQVVNGYFVKRTAKMDDTIKYLAKLTGMLKRDYERKTLNVIPTHVLTAQNYLPLLSKLRERDPLLGYYISYPAFASLASKSEMMTLRDVFLKMLMTTRGVTGERALEIQKRWKTPHAFVKAFEACGSGELGRKRKRELVSTELDHLVGRTKISKQLGQKIAEVWGDA
ncbi:hypothetical protein ACCO45_003468 [Purpureocillium lilacinum]|uniref:Uncharacterized protein n=1 Tax=Purpureocillium lilacinum TaxID=33203 RepID=A0ACC4DZZ2_PURLI